MKWVDFDEPLEAIIANLPLESLAIEGLRVGHAILRCNEVKQSADKIPGLLNLLQGTGGICGCFSTPLGPRLPLWSARVIPSRRFGERGHSASADHHMK